MSWLFEAECRPKCRSKNHALEFHTAISKGSLKEVKAYSRLCHNSTQLKDTVGRTALHVSAACGKGEVIDWLIEEKNGDVKEKDMESGWTALHRALFYGQLRAARNLIQRGSDLYARDNEGLSPLDLLMKDRPRQLKYSVQEPSEVYVWGDNSNFNLGQASGQSRSSPEVIDEFKRSGVSIKDMVLCKYHTVFLSQSGHVYTCGHGHGGRLGHENELTCVVPKLVKSMSHGTCLQIAASRDHTVLLMENGYAYSCGVNDFHQLGQIPPPEKSIKPKQISLKGLKGKPILGICVGRFHTVVYTAESIFTFGLNAGQLGHHKGEMIQSTPKVVTALSQKEIVFTNVACSDAATVCLTKKGEIYVLHQYLCRRIISKWGTVSKMLVYGGKLDHKMEGDMLREKGGSEMNIALLTTAGKVYIWRESLPTFYRCHWAVKRQLIVVDVTFSQSTIAVITDAGEAFIGHWSNKRPTPPRELPKKNVDTFEKTSLMDLLKDDIETVQVTRIVNIHRATKIAADRKTSNFMVLQTLPNGCLSELPSVSGSQLSGDVQQLLDEADEFDAIHDVVVQAENQRWPCHKYILAMKCDHFRNKVLKLTSIEDDDESYPQDKPVITIIDIPGEIIQQVLQFIYTDTCDLLKVGSKFDPITVKSETEKGQGDHGGIIENEKEELLISENIGKMSAYEVHQKMKKMSGKSSQKEISDLSPNKKDPVRYLQEVARQLGVKGLSKRLDAVKYVNGKVQSTGKFIAPARIKFDRNKLPELYDVNIEADDDCCVPCHKCILVARLEYFHSMLGSGWIETSNSTSLTLPVPGDVLEILLDYLYSDEAAIVTDCQNAELLCNILVVADQLLITRLREMCEVSLASLITFRNVGEMLEFSSAYNATQLRATCQQFIMFNMGALFEGRYLDVLSDDTLQELQNYYRDMLSCMSRRMITPYSGHPSKDYLEVLASKYQEDPLTPRSESSNKKSKPKKRRSRTKSMSEDTDRQTSEGNPRERQISFCSDVSIEEDLQIVEEISTDHVMEEVDQEQQSNSATSVGIPIPKRKEVPAILAYSSPPVASQGVWGSAAESPLSPQSPTGGKSLRDIMNQQKDRRLKHGPEKRASGGKVSWKEVKKQQNMAAAAQNTQTPTAQDETKKHTVCPWGSVNKVVQSFRDLMLEEKPSVPGNKIPLAHKAPSSSATTSSKSPAGKASSSAACNISWGLPTSKQTRHRPRPPSPETLTLPSPPTNPWQMSEASSPPTSSLSFSDILKDEQEKKKTLDYASKKPLSLIQIEEQAIQELLLHYQAAATVDEHITVERVPRERAAPLWSVNKQRGAAAAKFS